MVSKSHMMVYIDDYNIFENTQGWKRNHDCLPVAEAKLNENTPTVCYDEHKRGVNAFSVCIGMKFALILQI